MQESHMEGVASRHGPRSCVSCRKARGEVSLTRGECASWVWRSESIRSGQPARLLERSAKRSGPHPRKGRVEPAES